MLLILSRWIIKEAHSLKSFTIRNENCIDLIKASGRSYSDFSVNITDCSFFRNEKYSGDGGVIYINSPNHYLIILYSMFCLCKCSGSGGAIFFQSQLFELNYICGTKCSADSMGNFGFIDSSQKSSVSYVSLTSCYYITIGEEVFMIKNGIQYVNNTNSSLNKALYYSGIGIWYPSSFYCSYCTFSNNNVNYGGIIEIYGNTGLFSFINVVHNSSPTEGIVIQWSGTYTMNYCIFDSNTGTLFKISGTHYLNGCFLSHSGTTTSGNVQMSNVSFIKYSTYNLKYFESYHCNADFPKETPILPQNPTICETIGSTIKATFSPTIPNTPIQSLLETLDSTMFPTIMETPYRSYDNACVLQFSCPIITKKGILTIFEMALLIVQVN